MLIFFCNYKKIGQLAMSCPIVNYFLLRLFRHGNSSRRHTIISIDMNEIHSDGNVA